MTGVQTCALPIYLEITGKINIACKAVGIRLLDHIIVGKNSYYSFNDHGLIEYVKS